MQSIPCQWTLFRANKSPVIAKRTKSSLGKIKLIMRLVIIYNRNKEKNKEKQTGNIILLRKYLPIVKKKPNRQKHWRKKWIYQYLLFLPLSVTFCHWVHCSLDESLCAALSGLHFAIFLQNVVLVKVSSLALSS